MSGWACFGCLRREAPRVRCRMSTAEAQSQPFPLVRVWPLCSRRLCLWPSVTPRRMAPSSALCCLSPLLILWIPNIQLTMIVVIIEWLFRDYLTCYMVSAIIAKGDWLCSLVCRTYCLWQIHLSDRDNRQREDRFHTTLKESTSICKRSTW